MVCASMSSLLFGIRNEEFLGQPAKVSHPADLQIHYFNLEAENLEKDKICFFLFIAIIRPLSVPRS